MRSTVRDWVAGTAVVVVGLLIFAGVCAGGWFLYWHLAESSQNNRNTVNTHSQQWQAALIASERDRMQGWTAAVAPEQKTYLKNTFCADYLNLTDIPTDVQHDATLLGCVMTTTNQ